jgi:hypothetical protein
MTMAIRRSTGKVAQAWVELRSDDPEAVSALAVARAHLPAGRQLRGLRRLRLLELKGRLPARERLESLLHRSTQFYNPHKERCTVRMAAADAPPLRPGEKAVVVVDRDGARRAAAERWWLHETGVAVEVREGTAWAMSFEEDGADQVEDLSLVRGRRHGLLCNPHSQDCHVAGERVPLPWLGEAEVPPVATPRSRRGTPKGGV